ncbi:MAG: alpha/beta fold hydrolase [Solirubrobacteraceae bacterium]
MPLRLNHRRLGSGEPLVLLHGIGSRWQIWQPVLGLLSAEHDVIALDLPGFGASPTAPAGTPAGTASLARLVTEFLDELGVERPHLAGNSLGGETALELAKLGRARSVTAFSPTGFHNRAEAIFQRISLRLSREAARALSPYVERLVATTAGRRMLLSQLVAHPQRLAPSISEDLRELAVAPWFDATLDALLAHTFSGAEQIRVPVTIAWAQHDRLLLPRQAFRAARAVPQARSITLRGCGHVPTYDDPVQVAQAIRDTVGSR